MSPPSARLTSIEEARRLVLARVPAPRPEPVPLGAALGRVLAAPVAAADDVPGFDNSALDGYAVRAADTVGATPEWPCALKLIGESRAGHPSGAEVADGQAAAISTGAAIPAGADAIVRVEDTERRGEQVLIGAEVATANAVRRAGEDIRAGSPVLETGTRLGAAEVGALAAVGLGEIQCARLPRVSFLVTGDELVEPGRPLAPGQIRNSNAYALPPLALDAGALAAPAVMAGDDREATRAALERALDAADVVAISGGVSVGEHDHVRPALESLGVEQVFWGVALRPGKPTFFGVGPGGALVFGLPGNPVSAMVTFILFARPALLAMQGADPTAGRLVATLAAPYEKSAERAEAIRVRLVAGEEGWVATPTGPQGSHVLTSMLGADGLAVVPAGRNVIEAGEPLEVELLRR